MSSAAKDIELKVQFWSLIGPLTIAGILLIVILRSASTGLPLVAVGGILLCFKWKWRGLVAAVSLLAIVFGWQFSFGTVNDWLWLSILSLSIASAFILTTLCFDQSSNAFEAVQDQSERYRETIQQLDDRLRVFQEKLVLERQEHYAHIQQLKGEIEQYCDKMRASEKGVAFARDELAIHEEHQRRLLQELYESRQYAYQLEQQLATACYPGSMHPAQEPDPFESSVAETTQIASENAELIARYEAEAATLRSMVEESEMRCRACLQDLHQQSLELANLQEIHEISMRSSAAAEERQIVQQAIVQELNDHIENLTREKQLLESTLVRLQSELEGLVEQEEERLRSLAASQETVVHLQSALDASESAVKVETAKKVASEARERDLILQVEELTRKWAGISQQISDWHRKLGDYHHVCEKAESLQQQVESMAVEKKRLEIESQNLNERLIELEKEHAEVISRSQNPAANSQVVEAQDLSVSASQFTVEAEREMKRLTGLYNQLKEQFAEKSAILDGTRKELFRVQEELQALEREGLENYMYADDLATQEISRLLAAADEERSCLEQEYRKEIEQLYDLVGTFVSGSQIVGAR